MENIKLIDKKELLFDIRRVQKEMLKLDWKRLSLFIFDIVTFLSILIAFVLSWADDYITNHYDEFEYLSYIIIAGSCYTIIKFPITTFFFTATYYRKIVIFKKAILINKTKLSLKKELNYKSVNFIVFYVVINIIVAIILNDETKWFDKIEDESFLRAFITSASLLLLTPCFVFSLNTILDLKNNLSNQYKVLLRNQFLANIDLFKDYYPINNFERIEFKNLAVKSKRGTFLLANYEDKNIKNEIIVHNEKIIKIYHDLWKVYCTYLFYICSTENTKKINKYTNFHIQHFFDFIFSDFFDFK